MPFLFHPTFLEGGKIKVLKKIRNRVFSPPGFVLLRFWAFLSKEFKNAIQLFGGKSMHTKIKGGGRPGPYAVLCTHMSNQNQSPKPSRLLAKGRQRKKNWEVALFWGHVLKYLLATYLPTYLIFFFNFWAFRSQGSSETRNTRKQTKNKSMSNWFTSYKSN
jgi:hypothetical protein